MDIQELRYPIGKRIPVQNPDRHLINLWIKDIAAFPSKLEKILDGVTVEQLNYKYRPGGWTVKQVVHHCTDSHINSIVRFKLALTENIPGILPYFEDRWAKLPDSNNDDISYSLMLLKGLHKKWTVLLESLSDDQLKREYVHPEHENRLTVADTIHIYSWHCRHHYAHVVNGLESAGKYN